MNQILKQNNDNFEDNTSDTFNNTNVSNSGCLKKYKLQFVISSIISIICLIIFFTNKYQTNKNEEFSKHLLGTYNVSTLYSNSLNYSTNLDSNTSNNFVPFVIGMIKIDKISLNYPILSQSNNDLLDISLCRFAGPMPNEIGNICIAGHNYVDYKFFSRLHELNIDDKFKIYDLNGNMIEYIIYKKYETEYNDMSCTSQKTNNEKIVTLLTCNNINGKRLVIVGKGKTNRIN